MRHSSDFRSTIRRGRRGVSATVVVHASQSPDAASSPRVGFVVSRAVGPAVVRTKVKRRLRHLVKEQWNTLAPGDLLVVRATPQARDAGYRDLGADLAVALERARGRAA